MFVGLVAFGNFCQSGFLGLLIGHLLVAERLIPIQVIIQIAAAKHFITFIRTRSIRIREGLESILTEVRIRKRIVGIEKGI